MIEVRGLSKSFGATVAVDDLSFDVKPGQVTGFLGPNGAGKSTTMRLIMGLDHPDKGIALVNGRPFRNTPWPLREVGALLEAKAIHPGRSAYSHLRFLAATNGVSKQRVDEMLDFVGLADVGKRRAGQFSLGMGQRLGIAAALLGDPMVLLFDEPVNGLDPEGVLWIRNLLRHLATEGRTILVSSHLMSEMSLTADHLVVVGRGRLIASASVAEFIASSTVQSVLVRSPQLSQLATLITDRSGVTVTSQDGALSVTGLSAPEIGELAAKESLILHELSPQSGSLEEAFMELTQEHVEFHGPTAAPPAAPKVQKTPSATRSSSSAS